MNRRLGFLGALAVAGSIAAAAPAEPWTFERALDYALSHNPDARIARQRIAAARAGLEQADAALWPRLQVQSSYTRSDNPMTVFGSILNQRAFSSSLNFNDVPDIDDLNARGMLTLPVYTGGRTSASRRSARDLAEAAQQDSEAVRNALGFEVAEAFQTVLKARGFVQAADAAVNAYEGDVAVAQKRLEAGTLLKSDVLDIEVRLAQAREDQIRARNAAILAAHSLRNLMGIEEGDFVVADSAPSARAPVSEDFSGRPELAALRHRELAAQAQVRGAQSGFLPRVSAFGSLDYDSGWRSDRDGGSYTAGAMAQWDIWDGFLTRGKVREARANLETAREESRKARLDVGLEVEQARLDFTAAGERLRVSDTAVSQAEESALLTRNRFEQGLALSTQLIDSETALLAARVRRTQAEADRAIAIAAFRKALGISQLDSTPNGN